MSFPSWPPAAQVDKQDQSRRRAMVQILLLVWEDFQQENRTDTSEGQDMKYLVVSAYPDRDFSETMPSMRLADLRRKLAESEGADVMIVDEFGMVVYTTEEQDMFDA